MQVAAAAAVVDALTAADGTTYANIDAALSAGAVGIDLATYNAAAAAASADSSN